MCPDGDATEKPVVGAPKDADACCLTITRDQEIVGIIDQDAGDARNVLQRTDMQSPDAVDHVDAVGAGMCDVYAPPWSIDVCVVEAWSGPRR
jgi:hypothetical protein